MAQARCFSAFERIIVINCAIVALFSWSLAADAQVNSNQTNGNCGPIISGGQNITINCPPNGGSNSTRPTPPRNPVSGGRWRNGEFIPTCEFGKAYSLEHRQCIPSQYIGGIIPCSADDNHFVPGVGWQSNCQ